MQVTQSTTHMKKDANRQYTASTNIQSHDFNLPSELKICQLTYNKSSSQSIRPYSQSIQPKLQFVSHRLVKQKRLKESVDTNQGQEQYFEQFMRKTPVDDRTPEEEEIRTEFRFRLPVIVSQQENHGSSIHFLEIFVHSSQLVEDHIRDALKSLNRLKQQTQELKYEMKKMKDDNESMLEFFISTLQGEWDKRNKMMKEDSVWHQQEQFRLNKELMILQKEKAQIEADILDSQRRIVRVEIKMQGVECFNLETDNQLLRTITQTNLRADRTQYSFKSMIH